MSNEITITELNVQVREQRGLSWREYNAKPRIHFFPEGESIFQNLCFRHDRPYEIYRQFLPRVLEALGLPPDTSCRWSQKAGCSCGCSPGFIVQYDGVVHKDAYVTVKGVEQPVTDRALNVAAQVMADPTLAGPLGVAS